MAEHDVIGCLSSIDESRMLLPMHMPGPVSKMEASVSSLVTHVNPHQF